MKTLTYFLVAYCVGTTCVVIASIFLRRRVEAIRLLKKVLEEDLSPENRIDGLKELGNLEVQRIPWYERSLSVVGIFAFFSMLIATGIQTLAGMQQTSRTDDLRKEVEMLAGERETAEAVISLAAESEMRRFAISSSLHPEAKRLIKHRENYLRESIASPAGVDDERVKDDTRELYTIYIYFNDYESAVSLLEQSTDLLDATKLVDRITLAEYYILIRLNESAREILDGVEPHYHDLGDVWKEKFTILTAISTPARLDECVYTLAGLREISVEEAQSLLLRERKRREDYLSGAEKESE